MPTSAEYAHDVPDDEQTLICCLAPAVDMSLLARTILAPAMCQQRLIRHIPDESCNRVVRGTCDKLVIFGGRPSQLVYQIEAEEQISSGTSPSG